MLKACETSLEFLCLLLEVANMRVQRFHEVDLLCPIPLGHHME
jgi:hypothetical protein